MNVSRDLLVPLSVPLRFILLGLLHFFALALLTPWLWPTAQISFLHNPRVLLFTHLYTLGWVTAVMMGAMLQLASVITATRLYSVNLARVQSWLYFPGLYLMLTGFWKANTTILITGGSLVVIAVILFLYNMIGSIARIQKWSLPVFYLIASLTYLAGVVGMGFTLALNMHYGFWQGSTTTHQLLTHVALGLVGWFTITIVGVSYRLLPMFTLSTHKPDKFSYALAVVLNGSVLLLASAGIWQWGNYATAGAVAALLLGVALFVVDSHRMLAKRMRRGIDLSVRFTLTAFIFLMVALILILAGLTFVPWLLGAARQTTALIYLGGMGWISLMVIGQLYKIVPFLVWVHVYSPMAGQKPVPLTHQMFNGKVANVAYWLLMPGVALVGLGSLIGWNWLWLLGAFSVIAGVLPVLYNMTEVIRHGSESGRRNFSAQTSH